MRSFLRPWSAAEKENIISFYTIFLSEGFGQARIDGELKSLHEKITMPRYKEHDIDIVMDRVMLDDESRLFEAVENAIHYSQGLVKVVF